MTRFTVAQEITKTAAAKTPIAVIVRLVVAFSCFTIYLSNKRLPFATQTRPDTVRPGYAVNRLPD